MNTKEIINTLIRMDNKSLMSTILPWQMQEICQAKLLEGNTTPTKDELSKSAKTLALINGDGNIEKSEYFCFLPSSSKKWKVYLVDKYNRVLGRLEDFEGEIVKNGTSCYDAFLIKI